MMQYNNIARLKVLMEQIIFFKICFAIFGYLTILIKLLNVFLFSDICLIRKFLQIDINIFHLLGKYNYITCNCSTAFLID